MLKLTKPSLRLGTWHSNTSRTAGLVSDGKDNNASYFWIGWRSIKQAGTRFWAVDGGNIYGRLRFGQLCILRTERSKMQDPFSRSLQPFYSLGIPKTSVTKGK